MDRRDMLKKVGAAMGLAVIPAAPVVANLLSDTDKEGATLKITLKNDEPDALQGAFIIRYPAHDLKGPFGEKISCQDIAREIAESIKPGCFIVLPGTRDYTGAYEWDITIVGNPSGVKIERSGE